MGNSFGSLKKDLKHVRWICGSTLAGKTTITRRLAAECDIELYYRDDHFWEHFQRAAQERQPCMYDILHQLKTGKMTSLFEFFLWPQEITRSVNMSLFHENFDMTIEDLRKIKTGSVVFVEGVFPPERICEVSFKENVVCVTITDAFYHAMIQERMRNPDETVRQVVAAKKKWIKSHNHDLDRYEKNETEFWLWCRDYMASQAQKAGVRVIVNDGSKNIEELTEMVKAHFRL